MSDNESFKYGSHIRNTPTSAPVYTVADVKNKLIELEEYKGYWFSIVIFEKVVPE